MHEEPDIARSLRTIEFLKAEMVGAVAGLLRAMVRGTEEAMADALASLVISAYVLGRRVGISFGRLDRRIHTRLHQLLDEGHEVERWYGDLSLLVRHLGERREHE